MRNILFKIRGFWLIVFCLIQVSAYTQKNDTIYMLNGDRITGELKRYENGLLVLKTDGMSTLNIEYDKIGTVYSAKFYEIVTKTGFSYYGSIKRSAVPASIDIVISNDTVTKAINEIVEITPIKHRFWNKFDGSIDLGLSYYKATKTFQFYMNTDINYRAKKDLASFVMDFLYSEQKSTDTTIVAKKNDVSLGWSHFFPGKWLMGTRVKYQQNTELNLLYRIQLELGGGYDIVRTNPIRFYAMAGVFVNQEKPTDSVSSFTNFEGVMSLKFTWLQHRHPKINISTNFSAIPSFTVSNRWRLEYNLSVKYELFKDFFLGLTFYDDYDSKPSGGGPALNDWSVIVTIGYSF